MLQNLSIQQFVIVERLDLDFQSGFTVLTGETGAGKSILIDAIDLLLGGRSEANMVRDGASKAELSASFEVAHNTGLQAWLSEAGFDLDETTLLLRRTIDATGKSRAWINGQAATLTQLRDLGEQLIDIHGQHAHQALLKPNAQRELLDAHAELTSQTRDCEAAWRERQSLQTKIEVAQERSEQLALQRDQLLWKINEIEPLQLSPDTWESLSEEQKRLSHAAELLQTAQSALTALEEDDQALIQQIDRLAVRLHQLVEKDPRISASAEALQSGVIQLQEAADALRRYLDKTDLDPERLAEVETRVEAIFTTARKLKTRPEQLLEQLAQAKEALQQTEAASDLAQLTAALQKADKAYQSIAKTLSSKRQAACMALAQAVNKWFSQLAMGGLVFEAACQPRSQPGPHGLEDVVFLLRNHAQANPYPIQKVASGGELARISLAISVVTTAASNIQTLIFDEVDSGIGGNVAHIVGQLLRQLGEQRQVLCVTHLPQVAARGHQQLQVSKQADATGRPISQLRQLSDSERVDEIARMLGDEGAKQTSREHARSLLSLR
jgi:DNA repair protein RecN (Recombination protein N)